jgi:FAD/FMN-containing dehydrogenase
LSIFLEGRVSLPQSSLYVLEDFQYWSNQQASQRPACRVTPDSAEDVSTALKILEANGCQFAVKSGGHASFAGASNIGSNGVAFDLRNLDELVISDDATQTSVGPGLVWSSVYMELDAKNLSVIGGRSGAIGVGGLTLGGGISFFSGRYGWACDNVNNYQVRYMEAPSHITRVSDKSCIGCLC